jgi:hypothetical protein
VGAWLGAAQGELAIGELAFAVGIDPDHKESESPTPAGLVLRICSNLVTTNQDGMVQLAHLSVKDYLLGRAGDMYSDPEISAQVSETCLSYLYYNPVLNPETERRHLSPQSFPSYATRYWPYHCSELTPSIRRTRLKRLLTRYLGAKRSRLFLAWFNVWNSSAVEADHSFMPYGSLTSEPQTNLFLAAGFGFEEITDLFSDIELMTYSTGPRSDPSWVLNQLDRQRHLSHIVRDVGPSTCLQLAAQNDRHHFIQSVLGKRKLHALLEMQYPGRRGETLLCKASRLDNLWAASVLISAGAKQEWLLAAKAARFKQMLEWLISARVDEEEQNDGIYKAVCAALGYPNWDGMLRVPWERFLPARAGLMWSLPSHALHSHARLPLQQPFLAMAIESTSQRRGSLLFVALACRNVEALKMFLNAGADARALCNWNNESLGARISGCSTLHHAAILSAWDPNMDTSKVVRLFIDHGALVNWQNSQGFTPLHLAARVDDVAVAETLLRAGARAEIKEKVGGLTAMQVAENFQSDNAIAILKRRHGYGDSSA